MKNPKIKSIKAWVFLKKKNDWEVDAFEQNINSDVVIACIDKNFEILENKTILVIENSLIHRSNAMLVEKLTEWEDKGLTLLFLPT